MITWPNGLRLMERGPSVNGCIYFVIPMNWYLETDLRHGTEEWDISCYGFIMMFNFKEGFDYIDTALQEVKATIFRMLQDPLDLI